jgi:NADH-quinone oxidoreductase subunit E
MKSDEILGIVERHRGDQGELIAILEDLQTRYGYLPAEALQVVSKETGRSLVDIFGVATFYRAFSLKPRGKHLVSVCLGTACHVRGGPIIADRFSQELGVELGGTTEDHEFTLETVNCLGACALGPIVVADGHYFSNVSPVRVKEIVEQIRAGLEEAQVAEDGRIFPVEVSCPRCNRALMDAAHMIDGHPSIKVTVAFNHRHSWLRLSSLYGNHSVESEYEMPPESVVNFFCPHCSAELIGAGRCPLCDAPMVPMSLRGGGVVQICSRHGCKYHMLDLESTHS